MPRLLGVEIPADKRIEASLTYIYGIGFSTPNAFWSRRISIRTSGRKILPAAVERDHSRDHHNKLPIEGDLRREIQSNLKRLQAINCYRGIRHRRGLPVRGQRTSTNARTRKGPRKTVGVIRNRTPRPAKFKITIMADQRTQTNQRRKPKTKSRRSEAEIRSAPQEGDGSRAEPLQRQPGSRGRRWKAPTEPKASQESRPSQKRKQHAPAASCSRRIFP